MRINTINKYLSIILIIFVQSNLIGCKDSTVKLTEVFQNYSLTKNQDVLTNSIGKRIESVSYDGIGRSSSYVKINDKLFYVSAYRIKDDKGLFVTLQLIKKTKKERFSILKDIIYFETYNDLYVIIGSLSYGKKNRDGYYPLDETKFGIYDVDLSKGLPFYQKIIPRYIISVENDKLKVEKSTNEDFFIYLYDEI